MFQIDKRELVCNTKELKRITRPFTIGLREYNSYGNRMNTWTNAHHTPLAIALTLAILGGMGASFMLDDPTHAALLGIVMFLVTLWTNEGLPLGVVSLLPLILFPAFDVLPLQVTASNYANPVIFLFLGGFMLAIAIQKTGLHQFLANVMLPKSAVTPRSVIFSLGLIAALLSALLSNTTTALLLLPIAMYLTQERLYRARFVLAIAYGASIGGIITPIGTPPNLILMGFLESQGLESIRFVNWMIMTLPLALIMLTIMPWLLSIGLPREHTSFQLHKPQGAMTPKQRKLTYTLGLLALLLILNSPIEPWYPGLGLNEKLIMLGFGLLMFMPGMNYLQWEDTKSIPYEIIFLFGAGFAIASAFMDCGLAEVVASSLQSLSSLPLFALIVLVAILITFSTEVTSNTALISLALPIIYSLGKVSSIDSTLILMVATICGSYAFMLPIATPPNAIAISSGALKIKEMMKIGFVFNITGIILISLMAWFFWQ
ncbi:MAG: Sodium-dependent transporter [uncultured Thiotrichaceae bacterium]|uniref:Sodium-dependent transporter n=1 Tax=uncultured Thiotrichaceae bacterium TaxID=298394 RepID=A0A6S6S965_9GAMM|nr:MAG: Sodium-dependent transporter [uncultured Thiotrichaceae bacterium]